MISINNKELLNQFSDIFKNLLTLTIDIIKDKNESESIKMISNLDQLTAG